MSDNDDVGTYETVQNYIADVRILLLDTTLPYRYDDPSLVIAFNAAMLEGRRLRPDLFVHHYKDRMPNFPNNDGTEVKMEPQFRLAFVYGTCGHALARDQESVEDARSNSFRGLMAYILTGEKPQQVPGLQGATPSTGKPV